MAAGSSAGEDQDAHDSALWQQVVARTEHAAGCGALAPIATVCHTVEQAGIAFVVRLAEGLERKAEATVTRRQRQIDPFLPYDEDLFVASLSESHVCLLNKFNVLDHHLLVITRAFEDQDEPLNLRDFEALWACLVEIDGLGFYNGGEMGGASQRHKHFQVVPRALGPGDEPIPIEPAIRAARFTGALGVSDALPFAHVIARLQAPFDAGARAHESLTAYEDMRGALRLEHGDPYNLLVTRSWMLLVPRAREHWGRVSVNALGFAGALLVRTQADLAELERVGPMTVLEQVSVARVGEMPGA